MRVGGVFSTLGLLALFGLAGCGGGGGSTSSGRSLTYTTDWTNRTQAGGTPTGVSELVQVLTLDGAAVVPAQTFNALTTGKQSFNFTNLPAGTYVLNVQLNDGQNFQGNVTGTASMVFTAGKTTTIQTAVGNTPASVSVTPSSVSLLTGQTQQVCASAMTSDGRLTFSKASDFTWTALGSGFTVTPGTPSSNPTADPAVATVAGTSVGTGSVRVTQTSTGSLGSTPVTVSNITRIQSQWTVMVYLNASNSLYGDAEPNVEQMERVGDGTNLRFVVQWKENQTLYPSSPFNSTRRYVINNHLRGTPVADLGAGINMADYRTLQSFVSWTMSNYPANHYALVIWDHGNGWISRSLKPKMTTRGISYDDEFPNGQYSLITPEQISQAIGGNHLSVLATDACMMQQLESDLEVQSQVDYIAGSEDNTPGPGYPYDLVFGNFSTNPTASVATLVQGFVTGMNSAYPTSYGQDYTQSVVQSSQLPAVQAAVVALGQALVANQSNSALVSLVGSIRANAVAYPTDGSNPVLATHYLDLKDIANRLASSSTIPSAVSTAAQNVVTAVNSAVLYNNHNGIPALNQYSYGLGIDFGNSTSYQGYSSEYNQLILGQTAWAQWLSVAP